MLNSRDLQSVAGNAQPAGLHNPIFVVGHPRSGTTLLRAVLSAHSRIDMINEPDLFLGIRSSGFTVQDTFDAEKKSQLIDRMRKIRSCRRHLETLGQERVDRFLRYDDVLTCKEVFEFLLPRPEQAEVWGTKELLNLYFVPDILALYPNALIIHILRDPKAALLSAYRKRMAQGAEHVPPFCRESIAFFAYESLRWRAAMEAVESAKTKSAPTSLVEIRYEDFVRTPDQELRRLCAAIGLEYEPGMSDATHRSNDPVLASDNAYAHRKLAESIDPSRAESGQQLPAWASWVIHMCAGDAVARRGYGSRAKPSYYHRLIAGTGVRAYRTKMEKRLDREVKRLYGAP